MKRISVLLVCLAVIAGWLIWRNTSAPATLDQRINPGDRPNIILVYSDDIDCESLFTQWPNQPNDLIRFPNLRKLAKSGTTFTNFHVTTPVCGPSRACLLSGQYAHRNQFRVNSPDAKSANGFSGGYTVFNRDNELGIWMNDAGYSTAFIGKYMHDNFSPVEKNRESWKSIIPRGWDRFVCLLGGNYLQFGIFGTDHAEFRRVTGQYRTDVEAKIVADMIEKDFSKSNQPFFLCWAPFAAHMSADYKEMAAERHVDYFADQVPRGALEADRFLQIENQPEELAAIPPYKQAALESWSKVHRHRLRSMQALDEGLGQMLAALEKTGQLENTIIIFTSDHGFSLGQHRHFGKRFPYDRITKVPFIVSGPTVQANQYCDQLLANIDIAPTLIALAGGKRPPSVDGISFAGLIRNPQLKINRAGIIIENWDRIWTNAAELEVAYASYRTSHHIYTEWASGGFEYYDLTTDSEQLNNLYPELDNEQRDSLDQSLRAARGRGDARPVISKEFVIPQNYQERRVLSGNFAPVRFTGFVEDDNGVDRVELELYCQKIESYWNGKSWSKNHATVPAKLAMPGGHISRWSYDLDTTNIAFDKNERMNRRDVVVNLIATDVNANQSRRESAFDFKMKINDPETWIDKPAEWVDKDEPLTITGTAADNFRLRRVELLVVDLDRKLFWDDNKKEWVKDRTLFDVELSHNAENDQPGDWGTWTYQFDGPQEGKIFFCPRAFDAEGNFDSSVPFQIVPFENKN